MPEMNPDPIPVGMAEFIRLLRRAPENEWSILVDTPEEGLLLFVSGKKYRTALTASRNITSYTMFLFSVLRIMEEKGKPWIKIKEE